MKIRRRTFMAQLLALTVTPKAIVAMPHIVLLGDSIFDNASYTNGKPDLFTQIKHRLDGKGKASLLAVDGATTRGIESQLARLPADASHLVMSIGGNDALGSQGVLGAPANTTGDGLLRLASAVEEFSANYHGAVQACMKRRLPVTICTIYNGNFPDPAYQRQVKTALTAFNDVIVHIGLEHGLTVIDLRQICARPEDYANPIEPSSIGGAKIADAIIDVVNGQAAGNRQRATIVGASI
jgi:lysophospholipase L1-like esterase